MTPVRFTLPLGAAHALLAEAVFARACDAGFADPWVEFEDSNWSEETRIVCSTLMARFLLEELRRLRALQQDDVELWFELAEAAFIVQRALTQGEADDR